MWKMNAQLDSTFAQLYVRSLTNHIVLHLERFGQVLVQLLVARRQYLFEQVDLGRPRSTTTKRSSTFEYTLIIYI